MDTAWKLDTTNWSITEVPFQQGRVIRKWYDTPLSNKQWILCGTKEECLYLAKEYLKIEINLLENKLNRLEEE